MWSLQHGMARPQGDSSPPPSTVVEYMMNKQSRTPGERANGAQLIDACITPETAGNLYRRRCTLSMPRLRSIAIDKQHID